MTTTETYVTTGLGAPYVTAGNSARLSTNVDVAEVVGDYYMPSDIYSAELRDSPDGTVTVYTGRAMAAARLTLRGKAWSEDDRAECAGHIAAHVTVSRHERRATMTGTPREVLAYVDWVMTHPLLARRNETAIPYAEATMTRLMGLASNWRRAEDRRRGTEHRAHSERVTLTGLTTAQGSQDETYDATEHRAATVTRDRVRAAVRTELAAIRELPSRGRRVAAWIAAVERAADAVQVAETDVHHVKARDVLASLGLPRLGRAYVAAYVASAMPSAANAGVTNDERAETAAAVATTLGYDPATSALRVALNRSRKAIPSAETHDYIAHADVTGVTCETETVHRGATERPNDWREHDRGDACTCAPRRGDDGDMIEAAPTACPDHAFTRWELEAPSAEAWNGETVAAWTDVLTTTMRDRLHRAAELRAERTAR